MKKLTELIIKNIAIHPEDVQVEETKEGERTNLQIKVNAADMPRIIGKEGKVIRSIRNLIKVAARKKKIWANVELAG